MLFDEKDLINALRNTDSIFDWLEANWIKEYVVPKHGLTIIDWEECENKDNKS